MDQLESKYKEVEDHLILSKKYAQETLEELGTILGICDNCGKEHKCFVMSNNTLLCRGCSKE